MIYNTIQQDIDLWEAWVEFDAVATNCFGTLYITGEVLVDKKDGGYFVGRTEYDSPEVDNEVLIDATVDYATIGGFVNVKIDTAEDFDLYGHIVK